MLAKVTHTYVSRSIYSTGECFIRTKRAFLSILSLEDSSLNVGLLRVQMPLKYPNLKLLAFLMYMSVLCNSTSMAVNNLQWSVPRESPFLRQPPTIMWWG